MNPIDQDPNPPAWLANVILTMQANQDRVYASNVKIYDQSVSDWIKTNAQNRSMGLPLTAAPTAPLRVIMYATTAGTPGQYNAPVDPSLPQAVLPPAGATITVGPEPILGPGSTNKGGTDPTLAAVLALLQKIAAVMGVS